MNKNFILNLAMLIRKAFKFRIKSNGEQRRKMKQFCGCSRFVFNRTLAWQNKQYEQDNTVKFSYTKIANLLPSWKKELEWLKDCHSQVLQQSLKDLDRAFKNFFQKRADFPRWKRKAVKESFRFPQGFKIDQENSRVYLPKIGWVSYINSCEIIGRLGSVAFCTPQCLKIRAELAPVVVIPPKKTASHKLTLNA